VQLDILLNFLTSDSTIPSFGDHTIGSSVVSSKIFVDKDKLENHQIDTSSPLCHPDPTIMREKPVHANLEHSVKSLSLRDLKFHEEELNIRVRTKLNKIFYLVLVFA